MSFPAQEIIRRAAGMLFDLPSRRWTVDTLVRYLNDAQRAVATLRPDLYSKRDDVDLVAGFRQFIPNDGEKFLTVHGNAIGSMRVATPTDLSVLDALEPKWRSKSGTTEILHWEFDPRSPREYHVYPPAEAGAKLDIEYVLKVVDIASPAAGQTFLNVSGDIPLPDVAREPLLDYTLYKCHSENNQYAQPARALIHRQAFADALGVDAKSVAAISSTQQS